MARASKMNRGYGGGLAAGASAGTGFQSSFQSSMAPMAPTAPRAPMAEAAPMAPMASMPAPAQPPPVAISNMFSPPPLPAPGQQSFSQPPPSPFGPAPLPFGGFRQEGGPVQPGLAYIVGEAGPELMVPQQPGMILPNPTLTGRASAQDGAVRSGPLSTRGATPVGRSMREAPERRLETAARRGDLRATQALVGMKQQGIDQAFQSEQRQQDRDFSRERDAVNFNQSMQMRGMDQAFAEQQGNRQFTNQLTLEGMRTGERAMTDEREQRRREEEQRSGSIEEAFTMTSPDGQFMIPGVKTKGGDFRPMGGAYPMPKPGATPAQIRAQQADAERRGYDLIQMPSGEWRLEKKAAPASPGYETITTDADGNVRTSRRVPIDPNAKPAAAAPPPAVQGKTVSPFLSIFGQR